MDNISLQLSILDIKVRNYLNIKRFHKSPRHIYIEMDLIQKKIPYFWLNASTLVTGYIIKTIDGDILKPVIGIRQLRRQRVLYLEIFDSYNAFLERRRKKYLIMALCCLSKKTKIPSEVIRYILTWTELISNLNING